MLEALNLDGKVVIVTGGGTGLGREMALHLAAAGADLALAARRPGPPQSLADLGPGGRYALPAAATVISRFR